MSQQGDIVGESALPSAGGRAHLRRVAAGDQPAELVIRGGALANVYTGEVLPDWGVAVAGGRIALIGPEADSCIGPHTTVLEARGQVITPGFVDSHTHLDYFHRLDRYLDAAIPTGLTTFVTETAFLCNTGGFRAVEAFLAYLPDLPITAFATAPTISYLCSDRGDGCPTITLEEMARLLEEPAILGLGEIYWPKVLEGAPELAMLVAKAEALGKSVEGHTAGARDRRLIGVVAAGISSCHEPITPDEVQARLRLGLYTMIRDGSVRRDLPALRGALKTMAPRRLMLASDTVWADDLVERGYLDDSARQAVSMGLTPMQALQAITLIPAEHFGIDSRVGGVAPGGQADLLLMPELADFRPSVVIAHGRVVAADGRLTTTIPPPVFPPGCLPSPRTSRSLGLEDLRISAPPGRDRVRARVIHFAADIVTQSQIRDLPTPRGAVHADPNADLLKAVALDRFGLGRIGRGLVSGFGRLRGAVAASVSFDTNNLLALGGNDADMLLALERTLALGGGVVVTADGAIRAEIPLPLGGITSEQPMAALGAEIIRCQEALHDIGCARENPLLSVQVLTFTAIPALRIRERGLWDVRANRVVPLILDGGEA